MKSGWCAIDLGLFDGMIGDLQRQASVLRGFPQSVRAQFARCGLDTYGLGQIDQIGAWVESQLPDLRRRLRLAKEWDKQNTGQAFRALSGAPRGMVTMPDRVTSVAQARAEGRGLAARLNAINAATGKNAQEAHQIASELAKHGYDPDYSAAFWGAVNPWWIDHLPDFLADSGSKTAQQDMQAYSRSFAAASRLPNPPPEFRAAKKHYMTPTKNPSVAWNRLAYLQYADFPRPFRAEAVAHNILDPVTRRAGVDWRGGFGRKSAVFGLDENAVMLGLQALKDGETTRQAFGQTEKDTGIPQRKSLQEVMKYAKSRDDIAKLYGRLLDDASGTDKPRQQRSPEEYAFAFDAITAMSGLGSDVPHGAQPAMTTLALAYKPEMVNGGRFDMEEDRTSSVGVPRYWTYLPGDEPRFFLSPKDTYNFYKTFVGDSEQVARYDFEMGEYRYDLLRKAAEIDADAVKAGKTDPQKFSLVNSMFSDAAGLEYAAQLKVGAQQDAIDKQIRAAVGTALDTGLSKIPGPEAAAARYGWMLSKYAISKGIKTFTDASNNDTRVGRAMASHSLMVLAARYEMADILFTAGYPTNVPGPRIHCTAGVAPIRQWTEAPISTNKRRKAQRVQRLVRFDGDDTRLTRTRTGLFRHEG